MAITPYSTPTQFQYKPLNLMAFAEPLMKMQEKYDLTKAAIEESDVNATSLEFPYEKGKAKALEQLYRTKRDELVASLMESKNYTQAASKLKQLNKLWLADPERIALETNYKTFTERDKEELARVSKGDITKQQYSQWRTDELRKFEEVGGTDYKRNADNPTGTYNPVTGKIGRVADMQKDFDDTKYKVASAMKAKEWDGALRTLGIEPTSQKAQFVKSSFEQLKPEEIDQAVEAYMMSLDRFKPWLAENAAYNFKDYLYAKDEGASFNNLANTLLDKNLSANERLIQKAEKDGKTNTDEYQRLLETKELLLEQKSNPNPKIIEKLYERDYLANQYDAAELGQIFKVNNIKTDYSFQAVPTSGTGSGGSDFTLAGTVGRTTPTTKELVSVDLENNRHSATKSLVPNITKINNIAGGNMRALSMGAKGSDLRKSMEANPAMAVARQQQIFAIFQQSKDATDFHRKLYNAGLATGIKQSTSASVFNELSNSKTAQMVGTTLETMQEDFNRFRDADDQIKQISSSVTSLKGFKDELQVLATEKSLTDIGTLQKLAKSWGTTVEKLIQSGVVDYTPARYAKEVSMPAEYKLSGNNIAKAYGFKSLEQAVESGFDFSRAGSKGLGGTINLAKDKAYKENFSGNEMGSRIVGDKVVDAALGQELLNASELTRFSPLTGKGWANVPGFDEEGRMAGGTKLAEGKTPKIGMRGNVVYMEIPYTYKDEDGDIRSNTVEVSAKPGQEVLFEKILRRTAQMNYQLKDSDPLANQTFQTTAVGLFNLMTNSTVTRQSAQSAEVNSSNRTAVLETIPTGETGVNIRLVKEYVGKDVDPIYKAYIISPAGKLDTGLKSSDINGLKVQIAEQRYLK
jgi:hypothetical protein